MNIVFLVVYALWLLSEILLNRLLGSSKGDRQGADKNTLRAIWITIVSVCVVAVLVERNIRLPISLHLAVYYIGLGLIVLGMLLRFAAIYSLGKLFTVDVTIRQGHTIKKDGMYKYFRHPSYTASLISFIGFGLTLNNWISLLLIIFAIVLVFSKRIKIEEAVLLHQFGDDYRVYKQHTFGLIPFVK